MWCIAFNSKKVNPFKNIRQDQNLLILRTNIETEYDVEKVQEVFSQLIAIKEWTIDLDDWEKVMKVSSSRFSYSDITAILKKLGYSSCELDH